MANNNKLVVNNLKQTVNSNKPSNTANVDIRQLERGVALIKQKANGKRYEREFYLDPNGNFITYRGSRKIFGGARICKYKLTYEKIYNLILNLDNIRDIDEVRSGYDSHVFHDLVKRGTIRSQDVCN